MKNIVFDFDLMGQQKDRATKKVVQYFSRAGAPIVQGDVTPSVRRTAGVSYREMALTFADGQTVTLRIKQSGDVFQVLINGKVTPMKNQDDHAKAIGEIVKHLDAGRAKFQAALAKTKAVLPKGIKSSAPKMEEALKAKAADLDAAIAQARTKVDELRKELGEGAVLDSVADAGMKAGYWAMFKHSSGKPPVFLGAKRQAASSAYEKLMAKLSDADADGVWVQESFGPDVDGKPGWNNIDVTDRMLDSASAPYGKCPQCGANGKMRERRIDGNDICENGHEYPSATAVMDQASPVDGQQVAVAA